MIKKTKIKIILNLAILAIFVLPYFSPSIVNSEVKMSDLYANPNQSDGKNPYKFKVSDVVNSSLLTEVVGCTGVVNKVSTWMMKFVQSPAKQAEITAQRIEDYRKKLKDNCSIIRAGLKLVGDAIPTIGGIGDGSSSATETQEECKQRVDAKNDQELEQEIKQTEKMTESAYKQQCFDGIAIRLAKNQLTAMTRSAVNWVNSGYGGNPFYIQNMNNFAFNMNKSILTGGISTLSDENMAYPFGTDFSRSIIKINKKTNSDNFLNSLTSDLEYFLSDPGSYYGYSEKTPMERAKEANERFANDFSVGGWNGWLALTQRDQNNPLGFTMQASNYFTNEQTKKENSLIDELNRNGGFLDQKVCTKWQIFGNDGKPLKVPNPNYYLNGSGNFYSPEQQEPEMINVYRETKSGSGYDVCAPDGWKTLTPGGIIKEKTVNYLNSPERQLELADTINESLNALFSILISKLESSGLSGLSDSVVSTNWEDTMNEFDDYDSPSPYNNNGAYGGFNLTRDLGNTFVHDKVYRAGTWDANLNLTDKNENLIMGYVPPVYDKAKNIISSNVYWEVKNSGQTKIIENGYNFWEVGDRAFWDGSKWQNWKCGQLSRGRCTNQLSPIKKRGVIQIQKDYIVAAKEILKVLPNITAKMGELDYCLPGPNPNYKINSSEVESAYQNLIGSLYVGPKDADRYVWRIDSPGSRTYDHFASFFDDSPNAWKVIKGALFWLIDPAGGFGNGGYEYNLNRSETENVKKHEKWANGIREYISNHMFKNFYESFDKIVNTLYYKSSTNKFLERENSSVLKDNPAYIPMSETGYSITRDILYYDNDIKKASQEYRDAISQAQINISKLEPIKAEVSKIILAAQARRDANLIKIINEQTLKECNDKYVRCMSTGYGLSPEEASRTGERGQLCSAKKQICEADKLTPEEYKTKYAQCLDEENIEFYDPDELLNTNYDAERCYNSFDDDLDGLVDMKDPDCSNTGGGGSGDVIGGDVPPDPSSGCFLDLTDRIRPTNQPNSLYRCEKRDYETCTETPYIINKTQQLCYWNGLPQ